MTPEQRRQRIERHRQQRMERQRQQRGDRTGARPRRDGGRRRQR